MSKEGGLAGDNGFHNFHPGIELPPAQRVVSLVPSVTESLFELGLGGRVVGITDYCVYPAQALEGLPRVGGTKNPRVPDILSLNPDLVIANQEENTPHTVQALQEVGVRVWLTFPKSVADAMDVLWALARLAPESSAYPRLRVMENTLEWTEEAAAMQEHPRLFCPIWQEVPENGPRWWMTFNRDTYAHDLLTLVGGENVFANRQRRYPLEADLGQAPAQEAAEQDTRYPRVTLDEILRADPQVVLLPSEPYPFDENHAEELSQLLEGTAAVQAGRIHLVDGSLITWHGTRLGLALRELPQYFASQEDL
jgi:iron complex transport system substrate-binding protein